MLAGQHQVREQVLCHSKLKNMEVIILCVFCVFFFYTDVTSDIVVFRSTTKGVECCRNPSELKADKIL